MTGDMKAEEVAAEMNIPISTVYQGARERRIGGAYYSGRLLRFDRKEFHAWKAAGGTKLAGGWKHEPDERAA